MSQNLLKRIELGVHYLLTMIILLYIAVEIIELIYQFGSALIVSNADSTRLLITKEQTAQVLPVFFNILIALGLIHTFSIYVKEQTIKVQGILLIALISMCRKIFILDIGHADGISNMGIAAIIIALALGYYLVKRPEINQEK
ncbi:MAG TPA: phosphate-starvation-inducible PsiE family protein [Cyclobacteriaceae bacterium]|nr:phosphate-starvation-inducible PsiE family protein [Cyclobacteriaceae bacterium]HRJ81277.1 phosphate-starvation-inducible PsiE family protein [Cyclobacteriaceae bacterium]